MVKVKGIEVAIKSDRETFARLLLIQQNRGINLQEVLNYELIFSATINCKCRWYTLSKTVKSKLLQSLEPSIPQVVTPPEHCPCLFDGMVLLQKLPLTLTTFGDISDYILKRILRNTARVAFFITDHYLPKSIKSLERLKRSEIGIYFAYCVFATKPRKT